MADVRGDTDGLEEEAYFELNFSPNVRLVSTVRRFVSEFYVQVLGDAELTSRLAVATHELLDNAVRYSADGQSSLRIGIRRVPSAPFEIAIETRNKSTKANLASLKGLVEEMNAAHDPLLHYQVLMRRSAKRTEGSGLGLGRIYAEADMHISCRIDEAAETGVSASANPAREGELVNLESIPNIDTSDLRATASQTEKSLSISFSGNADSRSMAAIDALLSGLHKEAIAAKLREVTIDLRELEFMNSSCFKAFVTWIGKVQDLPHAEQYHMVFRSDDTKHWQRRSLGALSCFAVDLIRIDV